MAETQTTPPWGKCPHCQTNIHVRNGKYYCPKCDYELGEATMTENKRLEEVREDVSEHMTEILKNFKQPAKITVLVRQPDFPDGSRDFMMTDDDLDEAIGAIAMRKPT